MTFLPPRLSPRVSMTLEQRPRSWTDAGFDPARFPARRCVWLGHRAIAPGAGNLHLRSRPPHLIATAGARWTHRDGFGPSRTPQRVHNVKFFAAGVRLMQPTRHHDVAPSGMLPVSPARGDGAAPGADPITTWSLEYASRHWRGGADRRAPARPPGPHPTPPRLHRDRHRQLPDMLSAQRLADGPVRDLRGGPRKGDGLPGGLLLPGRHRAAGRGALRGLAAVRQQAVHRAGAAEGHPAVRHSPLRRDSGDGFRDIRRSRPTGRVCEREFPGRSPIANHATALVTPPLRHSGTT